MDFTKLASDQSISDSKTALVKNGILVTVVKDKEEAKKVVADLIPENSSVFTMTSITLEESGIKELINESGKYQSVRAKFPSLSDDEKRCLGASPDWSIASAHAVTEKGQIVIASNTGSQLPAAAYGAKNVVFVVSTKKIVKDLDEAFQRIEYIIPLESERSKKAYNLPDSWRTFPSKILIIQREVQENRIHLIFVKESLGF